MEFDPTQYVSTSGAARLAQLSVPRIHQLRTAGTLPALATAAGHLFKVDDCLRLRRDREQQRALAAARRVKG